MPRRKVLTKQQPLSDDPSKLNLGRRGRHVAAQDYRVADLPKRGYSVDDLMMLYPFSRGFIWKLIRSGELRATRISRRVIVMADDLADFDRRKRMESDTAA
jgi:hypothetical protein